MIGARVVDAVLIGGSGVGEHLRSLGGHPLGITTAFGTIRGQVLETDGRKILMLPRHGRGHKNPPHLVNYRGQARAAAELGAQLCISTAAVGALTTEIPIRQTVICDGMIDACRQRPLTQFDAGVRHTPISDPFATSVREALLKASPTSRNGGVYLGVDGPRFETPDEIQMYRRWGGDLVGMTASSESIAMAESGIPYGLLAIVTNYGCGLSDIPPSDDEVQEIMRDESPLISEILIKSAVDWLAKNVSPNA